MKGIGINYSQILKLLLFVFVISFLSSCGGGSSNSSNIISQDARVVSGVAQKGPFFIGSSVVISTLDSVGNPTGEVINTKISSKKGGYEFEIPESLDNSSGNFYIEVKGKAFDESSGAFSSSEISLSAYTQDIDSNSVNLMTHWSSERIKALLAEGKTFDQSVKQAENELEKVFGIEHVNHLDITSSELPTDSAKLLLLSGVLMEVSQLHGVEPQLVIDEISGDFSSDGELSEQGDNWFLRMQAIIRDNPNAHVKRYAKTLHEKQSIDSISVSEFPAGFPLVSRPVANVPSELFAEPGETIILDGSASHDSGNIINFTWFRVDQQTQYPVPVSDRFVASPTITTPNEAEVLAAPNQEIALLYALVVTDEDKLTHTGIVKVIVKKPPEINVPPIADPQQLTTDEDVPLKITLTGSDEDGDPIEFNLTTPQSLAHGILELDPDFGSVLPYVLYTPTSNYNGADSFNFLVNDGFDSSTAAVIDILIHPVNDAPIADTQSITTPEGVPVDIILTGSDIENDSLTFSLDSNVPQNGSLTGTPPNVTYTPNSLFTGNDQFNFTVNDGSLDSSPSLVTILVEDTNIPPYAIATLNANQPINEMTELALIGGESGDDDGTIVSYLWEQIGTPLVTLSNPNVANPTFTTPSVTSTPLILRFRLTVTDNDGASDSDIIDIEVVATVNSPPTANAGSDQSVTTGDSVTLQGTGTDSDGNIIAYQWTHSYGGTVSLSDDTIPNPSFTAPAVSSSPETYTFYLVVTDDDGALSAADSVEITVNPQLNPTAQDVSMNVSDYIDIVLNGNDPDGDNTNLVYEIVTLPTSGTLTGVSSVPMSITGNTIEYVADYYSPNPDSFTYRVMDEQGLYSNTATVDLTECIVSQPIAIVGDNRDVLVGDTVTLIGDGIADPSCDVGDNINMLYESDYTWTQLSTDPIQVDLINTPSARTPTFTLNSSQIALVTSVTTLTFELTVSNFGAVPEISDPVSMTVTLHPDSTTLPPGNQPPSSSVYDIEVLGNGSSLPIRLLETDPDGDNEGITYSIIAPPSNGTFTQIDDYYRFGITYWYQPNYPEVASVGFTDSFTFIATDQDGLSTAPITVNIGRIPEPGSNLAPVLNGDDISVSPYTDFANRLYIFDFVQGVNIIDEDVNDIRYIEISRDESNGVDFSFQSYGFLRANNTNRSTPGAGEIVLKAVDKYGRESAEATFSINFTD